MDKPVWFGIRLVCSVLFCSILSVLLFVCLFIFYKNTKLYAAKSIYIRAKCKSLFRICMFFSDIIYFKLYF